MCVGSGSAPLSGLLEKNNQICILKVARLWTLAQLSTRLASFRSVSVQFQSSFRRVQFRFWTDPTPPWPATQTAAKAQTKPYLSNLGPHTHPPTTASRVSGGFLGG